MLWTGVERETAIVRLRLQHNYQLAFGDNSPPFSILVMQLDHDGDGEFAGRIADKLKQNFSGAVDVEAVNASMGDAWNGTENRAVFDRAMQWLQLSGRRVIVWGRVWTDGSYSLRVLSSSDSVGALSDRIDSRNGDKSSTGEADATAAVGSRIVSKALQSISQAYKNANRPGTLAPGKALVAELMPVINMLDKFIEQPTGSDALSLHDRVALVTQFSDACQTLADYADEDGPLHDLAVPALRRLFQAGVASQGSASDRFWVAERLGNALNTLGDHDHAIEAFTIATGGSTASEAIADFSFNIDKRPAGVSEIDYAVAQVNAANAIEGKAEFEGPDQLGKFEEARTLYEKAIRAMEAYHPFNANEGLSPDARTPNFVDLQWANAQDRLGLVITKIARLSTPPTTALKPAFDALRQALRVRRKDTVPSDWAFTLTRLGEAYEVAGYANPTRTAELQKADICFTQAKPYIVNAGRNAGFIESHTNKLDQYGRLQTNELPTNWRWTPP